MQKYLVVGLGNPGPEYKYTRHNVGFLILDHLAEALDVSFASERYAQVAKSRYRGKILVLIKPQTYMNLSGKAVRYWIEKEKIPLENLLVVSDDIHLPLGQIRLRGSGSHGGHNGLKHIIAIMGTQQFNRLRVGVGKNFAPGEQANYVLGKWSEEEIKLLPSVIDRSLDAIKTWLLEGLGKAMSLFNRKPGQDERK